MLNDDSLKIVKKAIRLKYDEHVGKLLNIPDRYLSKIVPNKSLPISDILKDYNTDTMAELRRYENEIKSEIVRVFARLKEIGFTENDKNMVLSVVGDYSKPDLYTKRFQLMLDSIERTLSRYGLKFEREKYRVDIPQSLCDADAINTTRKIKAEISNELEMLVQSSKFKSNGDGGQWMIKAARSRPSPAKLSDRDLMLRAIDLAQNARAKQARYPRK